MPSSLYATAPKSATSSLWLEHLPPEIQLRIAKLVTCKQSGLDALTLAKVSPTQRNVVCQALDRSLCGVFAKHKHGLVHEWVQVFHDVRVLQLCEHPPNFALLTSPNLEVVHVEDEPFQLEALSESDVKLKKLYLTIRYRTPAYLVCRTLAKVSFKILNIRDMGNSFFKEVDPIELANVCASVETLTLEILCSLDGAMVRFITALPLLRDLCFTAIDIDTQPEMLSLLKKLEGVHLMGWDSHLSRLIGTTMLTTTDIKYLCLQPTIGLSKEDMIEFCETVKKMPYLESLTINLSRGAERYFPRLSSLTDFHVCWQDCFEELEDEPYYKPSEGSLAKMIDGMPFLTGLWVQDIRLSEAEVITVIRKLGKRLRDFYMSVNGQDVESYERLLTILKALIRYADNLKDVGIYTGYNEVPVMWTAKRKMLLYLDRLHRKAPDVDITSIEDFIVEWVEASDCEDNGEHLTQKDMFRKTLELRVCRRGMSQAGDTFHMIALAGLLTTGCEGLEQDPCAAEELCRQAIELGDTGDAFLKLWELTENDDDSSLEPTPGGALELIVDMDRRRVKCLAHFAEVFYQGTIRRAPNDRAAVRLLELAIENGYMDPCLLQLAELLSRSACVVPRDSRRAVELYKRAIDECNSLTALCEISTILVHGDSDTPRDIAGAVSYLGRCVNTGCGRCTHTLVSILKEGYDGTPPDPEGAVGLLQSAVERGDTDSMCFLAKMYYDGYEGHPPDYGKAAALLDKAITKDQNLTALQFRAYMYYEGWDHEPPDCKRAVELYEHAIQEGDVRSCISLGKILEDGYDDVPPNPDEAIRLYERAINMGDRDVRGKALSFYATLLSAGCGELLPDPVRAAELHREAIDEGFTDSLRYLGNLLRDGCGELQPDLDEACKLYQKAIDEAGDVKAMRRLGRIIEDGYGDVKANPVRAAELYRQAVEAGDVLSYVPLADVLKDGGENLPADVEQAVELYKKGVEADDPRAMCSLGSIMETGYGNEHPDELGAIELYTRAIDDHDCGKAMRYLGYILRHGYLDKPPDTKSAMDLFTRGADAYDSWSKIVMAEMIEEGYDDVTADVERARRIYFEIVNEDHSARVRAYAMRRVGYITETTCDGDQKLLAQAARLYQESIKLNERPFTLFRLALLTRNGYEGQAPDMAKVVRLLRKAVGYDLYGPPFLELADIVGRGYGDQEGDPAEAERLVEEGVVVLWKSLDINR